MTVALLTAHKREQESRSRRTDKLLTLSSLLGNFLVRVTLSAAGLRSPHQRLLKFFKLHAISILVRDFAIGAHRKMGGSRARWHHTGDLHLGGLVFSVYFMNLDPFKPFIQIHGRVA